MLGCKFHFERADVVFELLNRPRSDDGGGDAGLLLHPRQGRARRSGARFARDIQQHVDHAEGLLGEVA